MDVVLLHNAGAGNEDHTKAQLVKLLRRHGYRVHYADVKRGLDDERLMGRGKMVVAAGGDGTVRKALVRLAGTDQPVAILPLGTANNIARSLGIEGSLEEIVGGWKRAQPRAMDLGVARGPWGRKRFVEGIGFGLIGRAMAILHDLDDVSGHDFADTDQKLHRDGCVAAALARELVPVRARLIVKDDKRKDDFLLLEVLNIRRAGPGLELARDADPCDGRLNVVSATTSERSALVRRIHRHLAGGRTLVRLPGRTVRKLRLVVDPCELRIDDQIALNPEDFRKLPHRRAKIEIAIKPGAVSVLAVPRRH